jgi:CHAD domain-containing protein
MTDEQHPGEQDRPDSEAPPAGHRRGTDPRKRRRGASEPPKARRGRPGPPQPVELELKFRPADPAVAERYLAPDAFAGFAASSPVRTLRLHDRYVDTADGALLRAGFAARLRSSDGTTIVTLKSTGTSASQIGLHSRTELEGPADPRQAPLRWPASEARSLLLELSVGATLEALVEMRQVRRKRELRYGGTRVEVSLDEVEVVAGDEIVDRFTELEVELLRGDPARLTALGETMAADPGLTASAGSKLDAALAAVRAQVPSAAPMIARPAGDAATEKPVKPAKPRRRSPKPAPAGAVPEGDRPITPGGSPGVRADDHVAEAGRKVLRFHLARMRAREPGTREGIVPGELKSVRVATRRMRAAWRVFGHGFDAGQTKRYRSRLRAIAGRLGAVRDLDVLLDGAETYRAELDGAEQAALEPLVAAWREERAEARRLMLRELDSPRYARFVRDFTELLETEGAAVAPVAPTEPQLIRDTAPSRIWAAHERVRAFEAVLRQADVPTLHELRISAKWLRYTIEFVREPLGDPVEPLVARIVVLQDHLGLMNDADVTAARIRTFLEARGEQLAGPETDATRRYLASREAEIRRLQRSVGAPWRGVAGLSFRRAMGEVVAAL